MRTPNDGVSGTACFSRSIVGDATLLTNRLRCPTAQPCPLNAGLGLAPKPKRTHLKANLQKLKTLLGLANNCGEKPHQHFTNTRLRKQALCRPAKVHTPERLATRPRSASPPPTCAHTKQSARAPAKPTTAQPAPQALPTANPPKPRLASKHHGRKKPRRPFSPPTKHLALPKPLGQTAQPPQRRRFSRGKGRAHLAASLPRTRPAQFSKCATPATSTPPNSLATAQPATFAAPKSFGLAASAFSFRSQRASSSAPRPTRASAARRVFPKALLATLRRPKTAYVAPRRSRVR